MARARYHGAQVIARMGLEIEARKRDIERQVRDALRISLIEGAIKLQDLLEAATTRTGERRVAGGGLSAGRHSTGNMIASISHNADHLPRGNVVMGSYGWFRAEYEWYFEAQDLGKGKIPAANAMHQAAIYARERYIERVQDIMKGRGIRS